MSASGRRTGGQSVRQADAPIVLTHSRGPAIPRRVAPLQSSLPFHRTREDKTPRVLWQDSIKLDGTLDDLAPLVLQERDAGQIIARDRDIVPQRQVRSQEIVVGDEKRGQRDGAVP